MISLEEKSLSAESFDPFSKSLAIRTWENNLETVRLLTDDIMRGIENGDTDYNLLLKSAEVISRMTDNTILKTVIEKALQNRADS